MEQSFFTELAYLRQSHLEFLKGRDPDPNWIRTGIQQLCLPISVFIIWIQMIRSGTTQLKIWKKTRLTWQKFTFFTYNNLFWSLKKRFEHKINCLNKKHFKQFFFSKLKYVNIRNGCDIDSNWCKLQDPDPTKMCLDPQLC